MLAKEWNSGDVESSMAGVRDGFGKWALTLPPEASIYPMTGLIWSKQNKKCYGFF